MRFEDAWTDRVFALLGGGEQAIPILFIGLDELVANKAATGRAKDLDDLRYLRGDPK